MTNAISEQIPITVEVTWRISVAWFTVMLFFQCFQALGDIPGHAKDVMLLLALYREVTVPQRMAQNQQIHPGVSYI